ncbi:MAG: YerC/YecD family TrpR-related protein [Acidobacteriota bacterium]|nr:YerC/YecD family TrpR-related protein [Acidobacteriota bacterium]
MEQVLEKDEGVRHLFEIIAGIKDGDECARFFRDLCTLNELQVMAERWRVARMVSEEIPYRLISEQTGASTATITRIAHWLNHGEGGYRSMLDRMESV